MAKALKDFDETQGIYHSLDFYKEVLKFDFSRELNLNLYEAGRAAYNALAGSSKNCN